MTHFLFSYPVLQIFMRLRDTSKKLGFSRAFNLTPSAMKHNLIDDAPATEFPKRIFIYWDAGFDEAPNVCKLCLKSWERHHPDWEIVKLDAEYLEQQGIASSLKFPTQTKFSNWLRLYLLKEYGGVWVDATTYCSEPLDNWLLAIMKKSETFFFARSADRIVANWFIAAHKDACLIRRFFERYERIWSEAHVNIWPYFAFHYLFEYMVKFDPEFQLAWRKMYRRRMVGAARMLNHAKRGAKIDATELEKASPIHKLTWKGAASKRIMQVVQDYEKSRF